MLFMCSFTQQVRWGDVSDYWTLPQHSTLCSEKTETASRHMISCGWSSEHSSLILWLWTCSRNDHLTTVLLHNIETIDWEAFSEKEWQYLTFLIKDRKLVFRSILYIEHGWDTEKMSLPAQRPCVPCITLLYISVQNSTTFPVLLLKSSKKAVFLNEICSSTLALWPCCKYVVKINVKMYYFVYK